MSGKGSKQRPMNINQEEWASRWDAIFGRDQEKEDIMSVKVGDLKKGTCGCGRSPTGNCCGWHGLSEKEYQEKLKEYQEKASQKII